MFPTSRTVSAWLGVSCLAIVTLGASSAAADTDPENQPRVRSTHAYIRAMIQEAAERSETFRQLVTSVEATNGIVYVEQGACGHGVHACLTLQVVSAGNYRILRILIDRRQPDWEVMASIGHELQHALEVLSNAHLTTSAGVFLFYSNGSGKDTFETDAAVKTGNAVRNQVGSYARRKLP